MQGEKTNSEKPVSTGAKKPCKPMQPRIEAHSTFFTPLCPANTHDLTSKINAVRFQPWSPGSKGSN